MNQTYINIRNKKLLKCHNKITKIQKKTENIQTNWEYEFKL